MQDITDSFLNAMRDAGCGASSETVINPDGQDHYYRLEGDKRDKRGGYCLTIAPDGFAYGNFRSFKTGESGKWHSGKKTNELTEQERQEIKSRIKQIDAERKAVVEKQNLSAAIDCKKIWDESAPAPEDHPYLVRKNIKPHHARINGGNLIFNGLSEKSLMTIQSISPDGVKIFHKGGKKQGTFSPFTTAAESKAVIIICEGIATAASLREATALPVLAAWDAGNLKPVADAMRKKYPDSLILIAADNDSHGAVNTGLIAAKKAGDIVAYPQFKPDDGELTDWNDYANLYGLENVRNEILAVVKSHAVSEVTGEGVNPHIDLQPSPDYEPSYNDHDDDGDNGDNSNCGDFGLPFKVLGYDRGEFFYYPFGAKQIVRMTASAHTVNNLLQLAPLELLRGQWGGGETSDNKMALYAWNALNIEAMRRGVFNMRESVRGSGCWIDAGRVILHCGDMLYCDGKKKDMNTFLSGGYTYVASHKLFSPTNKPLSSKEAVQLRELCESVTWENKLSGSLLAGWLVIAPICGALAWRPHIWITGEAESGKSTVMDKIVKPALGKIHLRMDGKSTEAGIRDKMSWSARPLVIDEAEPGKNMDSIVELVRGASDGKETNKYQTDFKAQFITCFASIAPPVHKAADISRISFFTIKKNLRSTAQAEYHELLARIDSVITPDFSTRLLDRTLQNMHALLENIKVFKVAARTVLKAARASDQIAPMLAGLYSLSSTEVITEEAAIAWVTKHDWGDHTNINTESEGSRLLGIIFSAMVRVTPKTGNSMTVTIGELINIVLNNDFDTETIFKGDAERTLRQYGILALHDGIYIANKSEELERIITKSGFVLGMGKWGAVLSAIPEIIKTKHPKFFSPGNTHRASIIPLSMFAVDDSPKKSVPAEDRMQDCFIDV